MLAGLAAARTRPGPAGQLPMTRSPAAQVPAPAGPLRALPAAHGMPFPADLAYPAPAYPAPAYPAPAYPAPAYPARDNAATLADADTDPSGWIADPAAWADPSRPGTWSGPHDWPAPTPRRDTPGQPLRQPPSWPSELPEHAWSPSAGRGEWHR